MIDIYYQNLRGIRTKLQGFSKNVLNTNYTILAFTETWLNSNISDNEVIDSRYVLFRKDRYTHTYI